MILTYKALKAKHPCKDKLKVYMENFPDNLEITEADLLKAIELGLDLHWFGSNFLPAPSWEAYYKVITTAWEAYCKVITPAWETYVKTTAPAWETYVKTTAPSALETYRKATAPSWETYHKATAPSWETYVKTIASALWDAIKC